MKAQPEKTVTRIMDTTRIKILFVLRIQISSFLTMYYADIRLLMYEDNPPKTTPSKTSDTIKYHKLSQIPDM
jgi:hypothetical protein